MYSETKFQFRKGDQLRPEKTAYRGIKQGDGQSPILINIFINDLCDSFHNDYCPVSIEGVSINCLLYADDLFLLYYQNLKKDYNSALRYQNNTVPNGSWESIQIKLK